ncbi:amino acid adenylation domain-containing protein [Erwiniaceae bacterium BAC15a-03b]|uniref:Amino acid adenylation domain-containing protein n=1 Tax=Winslowiella arboricola TaxID=2978220 RepID=A0A9J6PVW2_9GAMM|nr:non-ribosomal peptide synthetase/type I polyketide synthase [Winslowiella arboricola]MCU5775502.1 amino acid adenylation domain-containing protein [Winslowiella arboricola]MCU5779648.1 amino acid adenylation domain-containing protein [Winslowiella arboricola]
MASHYPLLNRFSTLVAGIEFYAGLQCDSPALRFHALDGTEQVVTFGMVARRARALAARLQQHTAPGATALILYPSGVEYVTTLLACFYAGVIGVPVNLSGPARVKRVLSKLDAIADDCQPSLILTGAEIIALSGEDLRHFAAKHQLTVLDTATADEESWQQRWQAPVIDGNTIAFLQYTSGSTGLPKGVINRHHNLLANLDFLACLTLPTPDSVVVSWLPLYHDLGLIMGILSPLLSGNTAVYLPPATFVRDPLRWLELASQQRGTVLPCPNFALQRCTDAASQQPERIASWDLSSVVSLVPSAEPVSAQQLEAFWHCFKACGLRREALKPSYGLAEATLIAAGNSASEPVYLDIDKNALLRNQVQIAEHASNHTRRYVGCGNEFGGQDVQIVNSDTHQPVDAGHTGEIWISGNAVAQGYWRREQESAATFGATLADAADGRRYMRTGDLGFVHQGQLFITGRLKDILIVRGQCHYPNDIEATAIAAHPLAVADGAAAFACQHNDEEQLVVVLETQRADQDALQQLVAAVRQAIAEQHQLAVWRVVPIRKGTLLRTTSGKVRRRALSEAWQQQQLHLLWDESAPQPVSTAGSSEQISWICQQAAELLGNVTARNIDPRQSLFSYGLDSVGAATLLARIRQHFRIDLPESALFDSPSASALATRLNALQQPAAAAPHSRSRSSSDEPVAIIGMAFRLPAADGEEAQTDAEFWQLLLDGGSAIRPMPADRFRSNDEIPGFGAFLNRPADFDAAFFGMSPREAINTDPQQRMLLEVSWHTLEDAGIPPSRLQGGDVGVYVGIGTGDYAHIPFITGDSAHLDAYYGTGNSFAAACGRLSYFYGWEGPSVAVDTACSSAHSALHMACQAIRLGECDMALAAGVKLQLLPEVDQVLHKAGMLAPDGQCKTFDASADGYVRGEGCVAFLLKPLSQAQADGDDIRAVIRGSLVRQDGASSSLSAPNGEAQRRLLQRVLQRAGLQPDDIDYLELHGTGTRLGDPIEYQSVAEVFSGRQTPDPLWLGSVKTNIGHLEAAAGASGMVKAILALEHGVIPPHIGLNQLNPLIDLDRIPARLPAQAQAWPQRDRPRRAGVTSYGFAGTLAHIVLEQAPPKMATPVVDNSQPQLLMFSAQSAESLQQLTQQWRQQLDSALPLAAIAASLARQREHHSVRLALVVSDISELDAALSQASDAVAVNKAPRVGFLFTGQGAQYAGMAAGLYQAEPAFRAALDEAEAAITPWLGESLLALIFASDSERLNQTAMTQPALFAVGYALARLWQSYGVQPVVMLGHSIGEFAALVIAGSLSLADAAQLIVRRGALMQALPAGGGMLAVRLSADALQQRLDQLPPAEAAQVAIAALNGEEDSVLAGALPVLDQLRVQLEQQSISARALTVSHAFHSPLLDPMLAEWQQCGESVTTRPPAINLISTLSGEALTQAPDGDYWRQHARQAVRFHQALSVAAQQCDLLVEIGPHAILTALAQRHLLSNPVAHPLTVVASQRRGTPQLTSWREALRDLYLCGVNFAWENPHCATFNGPLLSPRQLPRYPFHRQTYWLDYDSDAPREPLPLQPLPLHSSVESVPLYTQQWEVISAPPTTTHEHRYWLLGDEDSCHHLADTFAAQSVGAVYCTDPQQLVSEWQPDDVALYLPPADDAVWPLIELLQQIQQLKGAIRLMLITRQAQTPDPQACDADQAALWGAARALAIEYPACKWLMLDIASETGIWQLANAVLRAASCFGEEDALCLRDQQWLHPCLTPVDHAALTPQQRFSIDGESAVLVAGAWGALGRHISEWLIRNGARHLVLTGRQAPRRNVLPWLQHWRSRGITLTCVTTDITDPASVADLFSQIAAAGRPLAGVFHCAGVGRFNPLDTITREDYQAVATAKVTGTRLLHHYTQQLPLQWFVCFTSISGVWGSRLQIHYGAANAWQDALMRERRHQGLPGLSISWGPWSGGSGMSEVDDSLLQYLRMAGIQRQPPARYLATLDKLFAADMTAAGFPAVWLAAEIDWQKFVPLFALYSPVHLFNRCVSQQPQSPAAGKDLQARNLHQLSRSEQQQVIHDFVRNELARTLRVAPHSIQPDSELLALGMDSILIMDFSRRCDSELGIVCPLKALFEHSTPARLIAWLSEQLDSCVPTATASSEMTISHQAAQRYAPFPLTELQYAYWIGRQDHYALGGIACHACLEADAPQRLDPARLQRCWNQLIARHDALRLIIAEDGRQQVLADVPEYQIAVADLQHATAQQARQHCEHWRDTLSHQVLPTDRWPLFDLRVTLLPAGGSRLHISIDMLINDATSSQILWDELVALYRADGDLAQAGLQPFSIGFRDYVIAKQNREGARLQQWQQDRDYWLQRLPTLPAAPQLPLIAENLSRVHPQFSRRQRTLPADAWQILRERAGRYGVTPASLLIAAFSEVLASWSSEPTFSLNLTIFDRLPWHEDVPRMVGDFTAVTLLALDHQQPLSFAERAAQVNGEVLESLQYRSFSAVDVLREWNRGREQQALVGMPVVFTSQLGVNDPTKGAAESPLGEIIYGISQTPQVWLDHQASEQDGALVYNWDAVDELFQPGVLDAMFNTYATLLEQLAADDRLWQQPLPPLLPATQQAVRQQINATAAPLSEQTLDGLFFSRAASQPQATALIAAEGRWSYQQLAEWSLGVASQLLAAGVTPGDRVAVVMHKGAAQVAGCLAIQAVGAAYVPLAADTPAARLQTVLHGSSITVLLTQPHYLSDLHHFGHTIVVDALQPQYGSQLPHVARQVSDAAYVIYTSGSTGVPKGVLIDHRGAVNTVLDINQRFALSTGDVVLGLSALWFDLSVWDIFGTLAAGGTLLLPEAEATRDPARWLALIKSDNVTIWNSVPALLDLLLAEADYHQQALSGLRHVFLSGDWIPLSLPQRLKNHAPHATLVAMGGATEASIWSNWFVVDGVESHWKSIPYGWPLTNQRYQVLDSQLRACPDYVTGDLWIGGHGVALGYENDPQRTAASFIEHQGERLYRTGDLARYWPDGTLEFLGRSDHQVKIAGNRIELGEIEAALQLHPAIRDAVVDTLGNPRGEKRLAAWLVLDADAQSLSQQLNAEPALANGAQLIDLARTELAQQIAQPDNSQLQQFWSLIDNLGARAIADTLMMTADAPLNPAAEFVALAAQWQQHAQQPLPEWETLLSQAASFALPREALLRLQSGAGDRLRVLRGEASALELFYSDDDALSPEQLTQANPLSAPTSKALAALIRQLATQLGRAPRILELGGRSGVATQSLLNQLDDLALDYHFTDASRLLVQQAKIRLADHQLQFSVLDSEQPLAGQEISTYHYDLVLAFNALHRSHHIPRLLQRIATLLRPGGWLLAPEMTRNSTFQLATVALLEAGYSQLDDLRAELALPLLDATQWQQQLQQQGWQQCAALTLPQLSDSGLHLLMAQMPDSLWQFAPARVSDYLATLLPGYMVPQTLITLDALPLSATGKVARALLPRPQLQAKTQSAQPAPAWQGADASLATLWAALLGGEVPAADAHFFEAGGDSLTAVRLVEKIRHQLQRQVALRDLFVTPRFSEFAAKVAAAPLWQEAQQQWVADDAQRYQPFPLTDVQQAYWIGRQSGLNLSGVSTHLYVEIDVDHLTHAALQSAWQQLIMRHEMLRAVIDDAGYQRVLAQVPDYLIRCQDLRTASASQHQQWQQQTRADLSHEVHDTRQWPLFTVRAAQLSDTCVRLCISLDNLICDGRSMVMLLSEWAQLARQPDTLLPPVDIHFRDYVLAQEKWPQRASWQTALNYWLDRLDALPAGPQLPLVSSEQLAAPQFIRRESRLNASQWTALRNQAADAGITPNALLLTVWSTVLANWSREACFTLNLTLFQRPDIHPQLPLLVGDFTSLSLLACDMRGAADFTTRAASLQQQLWEDLGYSEVSAVRVLREAARRRGRIDAVAMPVVFTSGLGVDASGSDGSVAADWLGEFGWSVSQTPQVWIDHQVVERRGELVFSWDCVDALFPADLPQQMFDHYCQLLVALAQSSDLWQQDLATLLPHYQWQQAALPQPVVTASVEASQQGSDVIAAIICQQLQRIAGLEAVPQHSNFFEAGATSLHLIRLRQALQQKLAVDLPVVELFNRPNARALASWLARQDETVSEQTSDISERRQALQRRRQQRQR